MINLPQYAKKPQPGDMALIERIGESHPVLVKIEGSETKDGFSTVEVERD